MPAGAVQAASVWSSANRLPVPLQNQVALTTGQYLYILGGKSTSTTGAVYSSAASPTGQLGPWQRLNALPQPLYNHAGVAQNGYAVILGGLGKTGAQSSVYSASFQPGGALSTWSTTTALPQALYDHVAVASGGFVWVLGGFSANGAPRSTVYAAAQTGGSLGPWTTEIPLPQAMGESGAAVANGYIYVVGGHAVSGSGGGRATVYAALIGTGGALGAWKSLTPLPQARWDVGVIAVGGYLWAIGGYNSAARATATVYRALLQTNGSIGPWQSVPSLPSAVAEHTVSAVQNDLFVAGSKTGATGASAAIYDAPWAGL